VPSPTPRSDQRRDTALIFAWLGATSAAAFLAATGVVATGGPASDILILLAAPLVFFGRAVLTVPFVASAALGIAALALGLPAPRPRHVAVVGCACVAASVIGAVIVARLPLP
jgi:hypothetical protein